MRPDQIPPSPSRPSWRGREAARMVGGQRRRLTRRESLPRSRTTPILLPSPSVATSSTFAYNVKSQHYRQEAPQPTSTGSTNDQDMEFYSPFGMIVPIEAQSSSKQRKSKPAPLSTPGKDSAPQVVDDGSQQQQMSIKVGAPSSTKQTSEPRLPTSPLPPGTPSKAAQILGVDLDATKIDTAQAKKPLDEYHKAQHGSSVWAHFNVFKQTPLTTTKTTSFRQTRFREEGVEPVQPKSKKFSWGFSGKKITKRSQRQSSTPNMDYYHYHQKEYPIPPPSAPPPPHPVPSTSPTDEHVDTPVTYEFIHESPHQLQPSDRFTSSERVSQRHMRKKGPRSLDRMTPITEVSHDELHSAYRESDHMPELDVISEYEDNHPPRKSSKIARSQTVAVLPNMGYEMYENNVTDWDNGESSEEEEESYMAHPGSQVDVPKIMIAKLNRLEVKSPLQKIEGALLDENEKKMQEYKPTLDHDALQSGRAADIPRLHETVSELKTSHEQLKKDFYAYKFGVPAKQSPAEYKEESDNTDDENDLVSICSSIDLDEQPVIFEVKTMEIIRVRPGQVKLIDGPPRRSQHTEHMESIITTGYRRENISPLTPRVISDDASTDAQTDFERHDHHTKEKRAEMPREEFQLLTRDWILRSPRPADQQPISMCFDADLLADQQIPPAPVLKDLLPASPLPPIPKDTGDNPPPSPPPKSAARKQQHMCVRDGHLFCRLDLRKSVGNRQLDMSKNHPQPLRWEAQKNQHGEATLCDKRNNTVYDEIHECEIPVCRMTICSDCALDMEHGWRQRVIKSWGHVEWSYKSLLEQ